MGRGMPTTREFITKTTQELQDTKAMCGNSRSQSVAHHPGEGAELCACVDIPGLNRAASQERFWPSRAGRCEGPPHNFVRMPFGMPSVASAHQRNMRQVHVAQEARFQPFWRRWRRPSGNLLSPQSLPRLRVPVAHEESFLRRVASASLALLRL